MGTINVTLKNDWYDGAKLWTRGTYEMPDDVKKLLPPTAEVDGKLANTVTHDETVEALVDEGESKPKAEAKVNKLGL